MKKITYWLLIMFLLTIMIFSLYKLNEKFIEEKKLKKEIKEKFFIYSNIQKEIKSDTKETEIINLYQEKYKNNEIVGVLKIGELIDTIIVQTTNNDYYLTHLENKKYSKLGSVFVDFRIKLNEDKQINIYGHNSTKYNTAFKKLEAYLEKENYEKNKYITLITEKGTVTYEIFSVNIIKNDIQHMKINYKTNLEWKNHFNRLKKEGSLYETNVSVSGEDEILVLQTCLFNNSKGKLLIINSRKVKMKNEENN